MIIRTVRFDTALSIFALIELVIFRVILKLLPSMRMIASVFILAAISIVTNVLLRPPVTALLLCVIIQLGFPSKILPIVSIDTLISLMLVLIVRAPDSLKMKHVEICILWKLVDEFNRNL
jgi:hypothetical protein